LQSWKEFFPKALSPASLVPVTIAEGVAPLTMLKKYFYSFLLGKLKK
jgi:hypothetical protein